MWGRDNCLREPSPIGLNCCCRAGRNPYDRELSDLIGELCARSEDFRVRWATHDVRIHNPGVKKIYHDVVGDLDLPFEPGSSSSLVTYLPEPGSPSYEALALIAS